MQEFELIKKYFAPLSKSEQGALMLCDDAAVIAPANGMELIYTKDIMVSGTHFFLNDAPNELAQKLLAVNVSDVASMGGAPKGYLLGVALPSDTKETWVAEFAKGVEVALKKFGGALLGGDTTSHSNSDMIVLSLTAIGEVPQGKALKRSSAQDGDDVYVTGTIGDAWLGLQLLQNKWFKSLTQEDKSFLNARYHTPSPRLEWSNPLQSVAHACTDVSDGLLADAANIANASSVAIVIDAESVPLSPSAEKVISADGEELISFITGGDDYELLFTAPSSRREEIAKYSSSLGVSATKIGAVHAGKGLTLQKNGQKVDVARKGFCHFQ